MGYLKFSPDLFVGWQELQKFKQFLDDYGFRKFFSLSIANYGIVQNASGSFTNFQAVLGTNALTIKINSGYAIDSNIQLVNFSTTDNITIPTVSTYYWIKVAYSASTSESGTFSIDSSGNLSGVGGTLLSSLRGMPNLPSRVKFINSSLNTGEYDVNTVTSNNTAVLNGVFASESNLKLAVVGTFTPDVVPSASDKQIFQYDGCTVTFVQESVLNTPPPLVAGLEFYIARVIVTLGTVQIQDERSLNLFAAGNGGGLYLPLSGGSLSGTLAMGGNVISGLGSGAAADQALRFDQVVGKYLLLSGGAMTGNIAMGGKKITGLAAGSTAGDALRYEQLSGLYLLLAGGTMGGNIAMGGNNITGVGGIAMSSAKVTGLAAATTNGDAIRYEQVYPGSWTNITLAGTYANGGRTPQYRQMPNGLVHLRGNVTGGGTTTISSAGLPIPGQIQRIATLSAGSDATSAAATARYISIDASGNLFVNASGLGTDVLLLDGLSYWIS